MDNTTLAAHFNALDGEYSTIKEVYDLIEKFVVPFRGMFFKSNYSENAFDWRKRDLYDDTAVDSAITLSSSLHSGLTNPSILWFMLSSGDKEIDKLSAVRGWFEELTTKAYYLYQTSNFNVEVGEAYLDCVSFGMTYLVQEIIEENGRLKNVVFSTVPAPDARVEFDWLGNVKIFYRLYNWTIRQIVDKFTKEALPEELMKVWLEKPNGSETFEILFCVYPREGVEVPELSTEFIKKKDRPFGSKHIWLKTKFTLGEEDGYYEMPVFAPKWKGAVGSRFGYSPAFICLSSILSLNEFSKLIMKALEKAVDPSLLTTRRGIFGDIDLKPGGVTVVSDTKNIVALESRARFDAGAMGKEDLRQMVKDAYFVDKLQLKESPVMTATEVHARMELMQRLMGPSLNRLRTNMLTPSVMRSVGTLLRYKMVGQPPEEIVQRGKIDIKYLGTAARAQMAEDGVAIERWVSGIMGMAQFKEDVIDNIEVDETARNMAVSFGVPASSVATKNKVKTTRDQRAKDRAEQMAAEKMRMQGEGMEAVGKGAAAMKQVND